MDVGDKLYWRNEACPYPCHCSHLGLGPLIGWPPALVGEHLSFVIEITEQTPRTTRIQYPLPVRAFRISVCRTRRRGQRTPPKGLMRLSHGRRYPACAISVASQQEQPVPYGRRMVREKVPGELARLCT